MPGNSRSLPDANDLFDDDVSADEDDTQSELARLEAQVALLKQQAAGRDRSRRTGSVRPYYLPRVWCPLLTIAFSRGLRQADRWYNRRLVRSRTLDRLPHSTTTKTAVSLTRIHWYPTHVGSPMPTRHAQVLFPVWWNAVATAS